MQKILAHWHLFAIFIFTTTIAPMPGLAFVLDEKVIIINICDLSGKQIIPYMKGGVSDALAVEDLDFRLGNCTAIRDNISWQTYSLFFRRSIPKPVQVPYVQWSRDQKTSLARKFQLLLANRELRLKCPDLNGGDRFQDNNLYYSAEEAFDIFTAHVAHALFLEAQRILPWRLTDHPAGERQELLSSDRYFSPIKSRSNDLNDLGEILAGKDYQAIYQDQHHGVGICNPQDGYEFMQNELLIGDTELETLANIGDWMRANLVHAPVTLSREAMKNHIFLNDRLTKREAITISNINNGLPVDILLAIDGCHQAGADFRDLARSINIPVLAGATQYDSLTYAMPLEGRSHRGLCWKWESPDGRCLWHTDDLYAGIPGNSNTLPWDDNYDSLTETERKVRDFKTLWLTKEDYEDWGFIVDIHNVKPGTGFGENDPPNSRYYDLGHFLGYWLMSDRQEDEPIGSSPVDNKYNFDLGNALTAQQIAKMGTWEDFMAFFTCAYQNPAGGYTGDTTIKERSYMDGIKTGLSQPFFYTAQERVNRGYGLHNKLEGCMMVEDAYIRWSQIKYPPQ